MLENPLQSGFQLIWLQPSLYNIAQNWISSYQISPSNVDRAVFKRHVCMSGLTGSEGVSHFSKRCDGHALYNLYYLIHHPLISLTLSNHSAKAVTDREG